MPSRIFFPIVREIDAWLWACQAENSMLNIELISFDLFVIISFFLFDIAYMLHNPSQ